MAAEWDAAFGQYYAARAELMRSTAYLLCGDWHRAEDLVQAAFTKLYAAWGRVSQHEVMDGYVRRILVRGYLDQRRRGWWLRERVADTLPERPGPEAGHEERLVLLDALARLPPRQRAVLVLRYWEDLSVIEVAALMDCSPGTVKSQSSRGLRALRDLLPDAATVTPSPERTP